MDMYWKKERRNDENKKFTPLLDRYTDTASCNLSCNKFYYNKNQINIIPFNKRKKLVEKNIRTIKWYELRWFVKHKLWAIRIKLLFYS